MFVEWRWNLLCRHGRPNWSDLYWGCNENWVVCALHFEISTSNEGVISVEVVDDTGYNLCVNIRL